MANKVLLKQYVLKRAGSKWTGNIDLDKIINHAKETKTVGENEIDFSTLFDYGNSTLNSQNTRDGKIVFNAEWAACLCLYNNEEAWNTFRYTIGHEEGHDFDYEYMTGIDNERLFKKTFHDPNDRRFILWADEVHADYYGAIEVDYKRENVLSALRFKANYAAEHARKKDEKSFFHPSWKQRIYYVENFDFDRGLIFLIASETKCSNRVLIEDVCQNFPAIYLDPKIEGRSRNICQDRFRQLKNANNLQE